MFIFLIKASRNQREIIPINGELHSSRSYYQGFRNTNKQLTFELLSRVDTLIKPDIINFGSEFEHRIRVGDKAIFHLEAFVAKVMSTLMTQN